MGVFIPLICELEMVMTVSAEGGDGVALAGAQSCSGGCPSPELYGNFCQTQNTRVPSYEIKWHELKRAFFSVTTPPDNSVSTPGKPCLSHSR